MAIYLDYCASTPLDERVLQVMIDVYRNYPGNADSRTHIFGTKAKELVLKSRKEIAGLLDVDPTEVLFTSGATESDNMAILGLEEYGRETGKKHIITTAIEHKAVLEASKQMEKRGFDIEYIYPSSNGRIEAEKVLERVRSDTLLVSVMHVNNETGISQPIFEIGEELNIKGILFHVDAAQSFGKLNDELRKTKYDMLSISGHKIHGPQGIGALITRRKRYKRPPIHPILFGGQQEYGFRPGTTPVALVAGFSKAAVLIAQEYPEVEGTLKHTKERILNALAPYAVQINGASEYALPNVINLSIPGVDAEALFASLKNDYAISNGSACTSGSYAPSYVLQAMGLDEKRISEALRISWWTQNIDLASLTKYIQDII